MGDREGPGRKKDAGSEARRGARSNHCSAAFNTRPALGKGSCLGKSRATFHHLANSELVFLLQIKRQIFQQDRRFPGAG